MERLNEALKGICLDPTRASRYDNPELYDRPENHGQTILVGPNEYTIASLEGKYYRLAPVFSGSLTYHLLVFNQEKKLGVLGVPRSFNDLLCMADIFLDEIQKHTEAGATLVVYDRRANENYTHELMNVVPALCESYKARGSEVSSKEIEEILKKIDPLDLLKETFGPEAKLISCQFPDSGFVVNLERMIPNLSSINSESDLLSQLEEKPPGLLHGVALQESFRGRISLHRQMGEGHRVLMPICSYNFSQDVP